MFEMNSKYGLVKVFAETIEDEAISQIAQMANSPLGENANLRIMPDAHAGAGCTIGTTMKITDKVCSNLVGVDLGCGVTLVKTNMDFNDNLNMLDNVIRASVPIGMSVHEREQDGWQRFSELRCWNKLSKETQRLAKHSLGTLGGGNHFIEAYKEGYISVHSGSRNLGYRVADYYQKLSEKRFKEESQRSVRDELKLIPPKLREEYIRNNKKEAIPRDLRWLESKDMEDYLHDVYIIQDFAAKNRETILFNIINALGAKIEWSICSTHNYIDENKILRKGAIAAHKGQLLVIPMNMRDGLLICRGKGNEDWNYSAPHGAGRLYSRSKAKEIFTVEEYEKSMEGIFTTCVSKSTLDEAPFVYKDYKEIERAIEPTVEIEDRLIPIYNFKAN